MWLVHPNEAGPKLVTNSYNRGNLAKECKSQHIASLGCYHLTTLISRLFRHLDNIWDSIDIHIYNPSILEGIRTEKKKGN